MDAVDRGGGAAEHGGRGRRLQSERMPVHVAIPMIAVASLTIWAMLFRSFDALLAILR
ncbi:MAG: hypothetical protein JO326_10340 [Acetobacteraceae bacterium]|nr:hypothetical protein [Acetobacteraceae bacterium]